MGWGSVGAVYAQANKHQRERGEAEKDRRSWGGGERKREIERDKDRERGRGERPTFHLLPHSLQSTKVVMGSSALLVWTWNIATNMVTDTS